MCLALCRKKDGPTLHSSSPSLALLFVTDTLRPSPSFSTPVLCRAIGVRGEAPFDDGERSGGAGGLGDAFEPVYRDARRCRASSREGRRMEGLSVSWENPIGKLRERA